MIVSPRRLTLALLVLAGLPVASATAQDTAPAAPDTTWKKALVGRLSGAQAGFSNWAEGGVNTLAVTIGSDGSLVREEGDWTQKHDLRMTFGLVRQDTLDFRKAEDLIRLRASFKYAGGEGILAELQPTLAAALRTQFAPGLNFEKDPTGQGRELPVKVSDFFSPATLTQTLGLTWDPSAWFTQRFGVAAKETIVTIDRLRPLYAVSMDKSYRVQVGLESVTEVDRQLTTNVHYKSMLGLFAAFNSTDAPDMIWENAIAMKVNSHLNVNFEWTLLYDKEVTTDIQAKEVFSVGVSYAFL